MEYISDDKIAAELEDIYFDMDLSTLDSRAFCKRLSNTSNSPDFEFNMSSTHGVCDTADELFFRGQLLPLQVSPRVMMVQRLSSAGTQRSSQLPQIQESKKTSCTSSWEYWDKDVQDNGYRHSNGSSQDSSLNSKEELKGRGNASIKTSSSGSSERSSSWFKVAFSWKILFGFRKTSKGKPKNSSRSVRSDREEFHDETTSQHTAGLSSRSKSNPEVWNQASDIDWKSQKNAEFFQKSLNSSTTLKGKQDTRCRLYEQFWIEEASARSNPNNFSWAGSTFAKQPSCSSFLPRNSRVSSFARRSSAPCSRVSSSHCSPTHSGVLCYNTLSDMQNAVQGAIAHCKQSHLSKQAPF